MVAELFAKIKTQMARVDDLLQDYLSLVRVAAIERKPQDLGDTLQAWAGEWQQLAQSQGVRLRLEGIAHLGTLALHPSTFRRALLNLVQNALDAIPQGASSPWAGSVPRPTCSCRCRIPAMVSLQSSSPPFLSRCIRRSLAGQG